MENEKEKPTVSSPTCTALLCCANCEYSELERFGFDKEHEMVYGTPKGILWCKNTYKGSSKGTCGHERRFGECGEMAINYKAT